MQSWSDANKDCLNNYIKDDWTAVMHTQCLTVSMKVYMHNTINHKGTQQVAMFQPHMGLFQVFFKPI